MIRSMFAIMAIALLASGCCGPAGCGPGCGSGHCNDCDGLSVKEVGTPLSPLDDLRNLRRQLICGGGCGETYMGEWISTPPDCNDPCCDGQFVGGAVAARPFCWQRGELLGGLMGVAGNLYGGRYCADCGADFGDCGCGGEMIGGDYIDGGVIESGASDCGCATCQRESGTRMAAGHMRSMQNVQRHSMGRVQRTASRTTSSCPDGSCGMKRR